MPTIRPRDLLKELARGAVIRVEYRNHPQSSACRSYRVSSNNQLVKEETVLRMVAERLIRPNADGLFEDGPVQSHSLFRASEGGA